MAQKKHSGRDPAPYAGLYTALDRIIRSESIPPLDAFLELGRQLHEARLDLFIDGAIPGNANPSSLARNLTFTSCRYHQIPDEQARLKDDQHVSGLLATIQASPGLWPYVRDELVKFSRLVPEELARRLPPKTAEISPAIEPGQPALSNRQYNILEAMHNLKATDPARRKKTAEIAEAAEGRMVSQESFKRPIADLKRRGLIDTKDGRDGGCWLTSSGRAMAEQIRKR